jgi:hypothetical protein
MGRALVLALLGFIIRVKGDFGCLFHGLTITSSSWTKVSIHLVFLLFDCASKLEQLLGNILTCLSHDLLQFTGTCLVGWLEERIADSRITSTTCATNLVFCCGIVMWLGVHEKMWLEDCA